MLIPLPYTLYLSVFGHEWTSHSSKNSENPAFENSQGTYSAELQKIHPWAHGVRPGTPMCGPSTASNQPTFDWVEACSQPVSDCMGRNIMWRIFTYGAALRHPMGTFAKELTRRNLGTSGHPIAPKFLKTWHSKFFKGLIQQRSTLGA